MPLTPAQRSAIARQNALKRSATEDTRAMNNAARRVFRESFIPTDPGLSEAERQRRGYAAYRAHMQGLARRSAEVREARKQALTQAAEQTRQAADALAQLAELPDGQV